MSSFPEFLEVIGPRETSETDLLEWVGEHQEKLKQIVVEKGAILFRGFDIGSPEDFESVLAKMKLTARSYLAGNNPREAINANKIYLSTNYPPSWKITLHGEMSHLSTAPDVLAFFSTQPPTGAGGQTIVASSIAVLESMPQQILEPLREKGVMYVQRMRDRNSGFGFGRCWQDVFDTEDAQRATQMCEELGIECTWEENTLVAKFRRPATVRDPWRSREVWFNQVEQWHHSNIDASVRAILSKKLDASFPHHATFGDESEFDVEFLEQIRQVYDQLSFPLNWQKGDLLLINNYILAHGRLPYEGDRELLFAMGEFE